MKIITVVLQLTETWGNQNASEILFSVSNIQHEIKFNIGFILFIYLFLLEPQARRQEYLAVYQHTSNDSSRLGCTIKMLQPPLCIS